MKYILRISDRIIIFSTPSLFQNAVGFQASYIQVFVTWCLLPVSEVVIKVYIRVTKFQSPGDQVSEIPAGSRRTVTREIYQPNHRSPARYLLLAIIAVCQPIIVDPTTYQSLSAIYWFRFRSPAIPCQVLLPFPISPPFSSSKTSESSRETSLPWHASGL